MARCCSSRCSARRADCRGVDSPRIPRLKPTNGHRATRERRTAAEYSRGALYGVAAVSIWAGWIVVARLGLRTSLTPWDIAALRFGVAGLLLLPYVLKKGLE